MALLFRQAALDRPSTPERLDRTLYVTTSKGWIALVALLAMAAAIVVWPASRISGSTFSQSRVRRGRNTRSMRMTFGQRISNAALSRSGSMAVFGSGGGAGRSLPLRAAER